MPAILATMLMLATLAAQWVYVVRPPHMKENAKMARRVVRWLQAGKLDNQPIFAASPWFAHFLGLVENPRIHKDIRLLSAMPVGTIFIWDSQYSPSDFHQLQLEQFQAGGCYQHLESFAGDVAEAAGGMTMHVFQKTLETPPAGGELRFYPPNLMSAETPISNEYYIRPNQ